MWGYEGAMQEEEEEGGAQAAVCRPSPPDWADGQTGGDKAKTSQTKPDQARHHSNNSSSKTAQVSTNRLPSLP